VSLLYKEDWDEAKERLRAWWAGESFGRCAMSVKAPRKKPLPASEPPRPATPEERWFDLDYMNALSNYTHSRTFYGGEAFPLWDESFPGHTSLGTFLGCPIALDFETGWLSPILTGESIDYRSLKLDESNRYWQFMLSWLARAAIEAPGRAIPAIGAFGASGDTLAWVRGTERLLYDVIERPEEVAAADMYLMDLWIQAYERFYPIVKDAAEGSTCWFSIWAPGKYYAAQNDFSYNIGPKMFRDLFLPAVEKQVNYLDYSIYHVDGVNSFVHVDALCELTKLKAIQIGPGAGKPSALAYMDVLKKVQAAGKNLYIDLPPREVKDALDVLSARGLFIQTTCDTEDGARRLLKDAERRSRRRH